MTQNILQTPENIRSKKIELFILSFSALFFELLAIRWLSGDIKAFTIFRTFPLVTCFVGLGAGCAMRSDRVFSWAPYTILLFALAMKIAELSNVVLWVFPSSAVWQWKNLSIQAESFAETAAIIIAISLILFCVFSVCVCIGNRIGNLFNSLKALEAYTIDICGAILGSITFTALSYFGLSPMQSLVLLLLPLTFYTLKFSQKTWLVIATAIAVPLTSLIHCQQSSVYLYSSLLDYEAEQNTYWSPYHRIDISSYLTPNRKELLGMELGANRAFYQYYFNRDVSQDELSTEVKKLLQERRRQYDLPFYLRKANEVLVIGAGLGQNVASALSSGAEHVDAVEIDPIFIKLAKQNNPYATNTKTNYICDDARHYFQNCNKKYDLIEFSLLDSHAVTGQGSSVRIDAYIYTQDSFRQALKLLKPNGIIVVSFATVGPLTADRIFLSMKEAAGYSPLAIRDMAVRLWGKFDIFFVLGESIRNNEISIPNDWTRINLPVTNENQILTDDWPYLYVRKDIFDLPYWLVVLEVLTLAYFSGKSLFKQAPNSLEYQMLLLGAAFMLIELHAISFLSLTFGSTWVTSAIVVPSILVTVLIANFIVSRWQNELVNKTLLIYSLLALSIGASYINSLTSFSKGLPSSIAALLAVTITVLPVILAGVIFALSFSRAKDPARFLAFNLFGAVLGALLEYATNYFGIRNMLILALSLYTLSFYFDTQNKSANS